MAIRFFRHLVNHVPDEFYVKLVAEKQVLGPILDVLLVTLPRDNLLSSACLDIFEYIRKENIKDLIKYLVENYREKVAALDYIETFREIERNHDNLRGFHPVENLFLDSEDETGRRPMHVNGRMMEHMSMDSMEEEYWNTSDDEEDKAAQKTASSSGPGPLSALVDYHSDEESDENGDVVMKQQQQQQQQQEEKTLVSPPPERLSEKRRREEDDEDELGKMMQHKRRNSQSSIQSAAGAAAAMRKRSFGGGPAGRKIDIRLSSASGSE